jgi:hypothetical protein
MLIPSPPLPQKKEKICAKKTHRKDENRKPVLCHTQKHEMQIVNKKKIPRFVFNIFMEANVFSFFFLSNFLVYLFLVVFCFLIPPFVFRQKKRPKKKSGVIRQREKKNALFQLKGQNETRQLTANSNGIRSYPSFFHPVLFFFALLLMHIYFARRRSIACITKFCTDLSTPFLFLFSCVFEHVGIFNLQEHTHKKKQHKETTRTT